MRCTRPRHCGDARPRRARNSLRLRHCRLTAAKIAGRLGLARSTVAAELTRLGLGQLAALEPKAPIRRHERRQPGGPGPSRHQEVGPLRQARASTTTRSILLRRSRRRPAPEAVTGSRIGQNSTVGFEYVHVCIDDYSRAAYVEVLADETGDRCARFLARAVFWFASQGVTVRWVMTDNRRQSRRSVSAGACAQERTRGRRPADRAGNLAPSRLATAKLGQRPPQGSTRSPPSTP